MALFVTQKTNFISNKDKKCAPMLRPVLLKNIKINGHGPFVLNEDPGTRLGSLSLVGFPVLDSDVLLVQRPNLRPGILNMTFSLIGNF